MRSCLVSSISELNFQDRGLKRMKFRSKWYNVNQNRKFCFLIRDLFCPFLQHNLYLWIHSCVCKWNFCSTAAFCVTSVDWCRWWADVGCPLGILLNDLRRLRRLSSSFRSRTQLLPFSSGQTGREILISRKFTGSEIVDWSLLATPLERIHKVPH